MKLPLFSVSLPLGPALVWTDTNSRELIWIWSNNCIFKNMIKIIWMMCRRHIRAANCKMHNATAEARLLTVSVNSFKAQISPAHPPETQEGLNRPASSTNKHSRETPNNIQSHHRSLSRSDPNQPKPSAAIQINQELNRIQSKLTSPFSRGWIFE